MLDLIRDGAERWLAGSVMTPALIIVLKATIILAIAALLARAMSALSAAKRHLALSAGIVSAVALPLASLSLPEWRVPVQFETAGVPVRAQDTPLTPPASARGAPVTAAPGPAISSTTVAS